MRDAQVYAQFGPASGAGTASFAYDANGNLTSDGLFTMVYDAENRLVSVSGAKVATLNHDPLCRLWQTVGGGVTMQFLYRGDAGGIGTNSMREYALSQVVGAGKIGANIKFGGVSPLHTELT